MSSENPEVVAAEETEAPQATPTPAAPHDRGVGSRGIRGAFMAPINAFVNHPVGRVVTLAGLLGAAGMMGKDCGRSEGIEEGARRATSYARNCIEATYGESLGDSRELPTGYDPETWDKYADLDRLSAFCRQDLGVALSLGQLSISADRTFPDGEKVKIGNKIRQIPVFNPDALIIMSTQCDEEESSY